jgi:acyl-CoA synthetase (NDP forming)
MLKRMHSKLQRLLSPRSICLFGSDWAENVAKQLTKSNYSGQIFAVHPHRDTLAGIACVKTIQQLPFAPDASFIGLNRSASVAVVRELANAGAGGAVCFASGFRESDLDDGELLQTQLVTAAGDMPILGPNCYGFINYVDNAVVWPDQHGGVTVDGGVAIVAQSSNVAINMTMQQRGLNLAYLVTLGNQAQTQVCDLVDALVADPRVSAIGLYLEGFGDIERFCHSALRAREAGKSIVVLKVGKTQKAQVATFTHTASMAGGAAASSALLVRLGIVEVSTISVFLETLKLLDHLGPLTGSAIASVSCSGGEAGLMSDLAEGSELQYPDFSPATTSVLRKILGQRVTVANPLDYHTYIWGDVPTMTDCFSAIVAAPFDLHVFVLDIPRADRCDPSGHDCAIEAICNCAVALAERGIRPTIAVIGLLPENLSADVIDKFRCADVITLHGVETAIAAIDASIRAGQKGFVDSVMPMLSASVSTVTSKLLDEVSAKKVLKSYGLAIPFSAVVSTLTELQQVTKNKEHSWVLKVLGVAHKTEIGGVRLNLRTEAELEFAFEDLMQVAASLSPHDLQQQELNQGRETQILLEQQIESPIAELIVGVSRDASGLMLLTLGSGGIYAELIKDVTHLLLPTTANAVYKALSELKLAPLLKGYRGRPAANMDLVVAAIMAIDAYVVDQGEGLLSLDVNPLMVTPTAVFAVDALIEFV